ncbi:HEAT repeat domain-containing protein [Microbacterium binotii]|uniref:HEAT repeat domain-containing protein n=1 Tax=Microbacterium binotii TaxID=462710 RepID=UPI001F210C29|nr:hypothetical protein [Microbacterium binotii]UIN30680.1 hypothetical protein LXM64_00290 [Microbacterium binotii]
MGFEVTSLSDLRNSGHPYREAVSLLVEELEKADDDALRGAIVRTLAVPWAHPEATEPLIRLFQGCKNPSVLGLCWAVGDALEAVWDDAYFDELVSIAKDRRLGRAREMVVLGFRRSQRPEAPLVVVELLDDPDVAGHAAQALQRLRVPEQARAGLERLLSHDRAWVRRAAQKSLDRLDRQGAISEVAPDGRG